MYNIANDRILYSYIFFILYFTIILLVFLSDVSIFSYGKSWNFSNFERENNYIKNRINRFIESTTWHLTYTENFKNLQKMYLFFFFLFWLVKSFCKSIFHRVIVRFKYLYNIIYYYMNDSVHEKRENEFRFSIMREIYYYGIDYIYIIRRYIPLL